MWRETIKTVNWQRTAVWGLIFVVIGGVAIWAYSFFWAPESVATVSDKWTRSGHAASESESFTHWADDDPPAIPRACAKCHSMDGYLDYLGVDGSARGEVDNEVLGVSVVGCRACHNPVAQEMTTVTFPSSTTVEEPTQSTNCMACHQGRRSTEDVEAAVAGLEPDAVSQDLEFINVHYAIAAATLLGGDTQVGYQYPGRSYVGRFEHVEDYDTCIECHDPHSTFRNPNQCSPCHLNVVDEADLRQIRSSAIDYDGDGNTGEPVREEILSFRETLYAAIQAYGAEVVGQPITYDPGAFPYFYAGSEGEDLAFDDRYESWTPRLVKAAYNYHYSWSDGGAYVHNAEYVMQLLYDSAEDLSEVVDVDLEALARP